MRYQVHLNPEATKQLDEAVLKLREANQLFTEAMERLHRIVEGRVSLFQLPLASSETVSV
jgi:hypothetical protein